MCVQRRPEGIRGLRSSVPRSGGASRGLGKCFKKLILLYGELFQQAEVAALDPEAGIADARAVKGAVAPARRAHGRAGLGSRCYAEHARLTPPHPPRSAGKELAHSIRQQKIQRPLQVRVESNAPLAPSPSSASPGGSCPPLGPQGNVLKLLVYPLSQAAQLPDVRAHNASLCSGAPAPSPEGQRAQSGGEGSHWLSPLILERREAGSSLGLLQNQLETSLREGFQSGSCLSLHPGPPVASEEQSHGISETSHRCTGRSVF